MGISPQAINATAVSIRRKFKAKNPSFHRKEFRNKSVENPDDIRVPFEAPRGEETKENISLSTPPWRILAPAFYPSRSRNGTGTDVVAFANGRQQGSTAIAPSLLHGENVAAKQWQSDTYVLAELRKICGEKLPLQKCYNRRRTPIQQPPQLGSSHETRKLKA